MADSVLETQTPVDAAGGGGGITHFIAVVVDWARQFTRWVFAVVSDVFVLVPTWQRMTIAVQGQQQTQWCWAAVSASVAVFYDPSTTWTQCGVVNAELGQTTCCANGGSTACNQPWYLDTALQRVGHLDTWTSGTKTFAEVRSEIDAGRPLGVRVKWPGTGAHFLVVDGYLNTSSPQVAVDDPWYGASDITYATLVSGYQVAGSSWTHSYETQP